MVVFIGIPYFRQMFEIDFSIASNQTTELRTDPLNISHKALTP
jgi:hypothetical protein